MDGLRAMGRLMTLADPRRIVALVQLAPLAVRGAVLPARPISAHPLAGVEAWLPPVWAEAAKGDPRRRSRRGRLHLSRHDCGPRRASASRAPRGPGRLRDHRPSRAFASGPTRASTCTPSRTASRPRRWSESRAPGARAGRNRRPSTEFLAPRSKTEARHRLALPDDGKVVVVSGGGWGIGDLAGAVRAALEMEASAVVCLSGHSERARRRLERRFGSNSRVRLLGFTDRMSDLLAAADALVHSTAGLTVLEAQIRGCPVISYGFAVGHIRANNRAYRALRTRSGGHLSGSPASGARPSIRRTAVARSRLRRPPLCGAARARSEDQDPTPSRRPAQGATDRRGDRADIPGGRGGPALRRRIPAVREDAPRIAR